MMVSIGSTWVTSYSKTFDPNIISVTIFDIFNHLTCNFNDLKLELFKVTQGQGS